jgi:hypothetical protein
MMVNSVRSVCFAFMSVAAAGCGGPHQASTDNFLGAIQDHYNAHPVCTWVGQLPVDVRQGASDKQALAVRAMAQVGLLSGEVVGAARDAADGSGTAAVVHYSLTPLGQQAVRAAVNHSERGSELCFAQAQVVSVDSYTDPVQTTESKVSEVRYTFHLARIKAWAFDAGIQDAFPDIRRALGRTQSTRTDTVVLTDGGWKVAQDLR